MVEYRREFVNEDFLDAHQHDLGVGEVDVRTEVLNEIDDMIFHGFRPSFDVCSLPDAYYHVSSSEDLYKAVLHSCILFGNECSLNWIDVSGIDDMSNLFKQSAFDGDISRWDVSFVKDMSHMFEMSCFTGQYGISDWDVSEVRNMSCMFKNSDFCGNISEWNTENVRSMYLMFYKSSFNGDIGEWDVRNVLSMNSMFAFSDFGGDISKWDVNKKCNIQCMFYQSEVPEAYVPQLLKLPSKKNYQAFASPDSLKNINEDFLDVQPLDITQTEDVIYESVEEAVRELLKGRQPSIDLQSLPNGYYRVDNDSIHKVVEAAIDVYGYECSLEWLNTSAVTDMSFLFEDRRKFNGKISSWDVSHVIEMEGLFNATSFTGNISDWDVSSVENMADLFAYSQFNGNISKWNVSNVRIMHQMFRSASFNGDISNWKTPKLQSTIRMFYNNDVFDGDLRKWDVSRVNTFKEMFTNSVFNTDISQWDVRNATNFSHMFEDADFAQDISKWKIRDNADCSYMFNRSKCPIKFRPAMPLTD